MTTYDLFTSIANRSYWDNDDDVLCCHPSYSNSTSPCTNVKLGSSSNPEPKNTENLPTEKLLEIKRLIFNDPATIIIWGDGSRTVVKRMATTAFSPYHGFCAAVCKRIFGSNSAIKNLILEKSGINIDSEENE